MADCVLKIGAFRVFAFVLWKLYYASAILYLGKGSLVSGTAIGELSIRL